MHLPNVERLLVYLDNDECIGQIETKLATLPPLDELNMNLQHMIQPLQKQMFRIFCFHLIFVQLMPKLSLSLSHKKMYLEITVSGCRFPIWIIVIETY